MALAFHWIPARNGDQAEQALNTALRTLRVLSLERHFCSGPPDPGWAVCIEHGEASASAPASATTGKRIDYRDVLNAEDFKVFAELRRVRKELATAEGVPMYAVMTNEQLALIAQQRCDSVAALAGLPGVGDARAGKYGERLLQAVQEAGQDSGNGATATEP
ncbi:MAG: HRDC domain-containing protein [Verrucomicrobiales bacterium]|nr:HRDC domain-containing protein [Verrucomicrobiales bacterium]